VTAPFPDCAAVVIGTSAGGVDALGLLLPALPADGQAAVFVVIHLTRERPSRLVDLFAGRCAAPVREATDKEPVVPGTVYFAPPDYHLLVDAGPQVALSADELVNFSRPSVDVLFESAADLYGAQLLGIVLTGASHDGASGLAAVARAGGRAMVQRPDTAQVPIMAEAALLRTPSAAALPLEEIADLLAALPRRSAS
jgi:two-component system chemotaxis response regulator CheB